MSKEAALRAMREARYKERTSGAAARPARPALRAVRPGETRADLPVAPVVEEPETEALCGHKAISGRTCTREAGHSAKSHRYA